MPSWHARSLLVALAPVVGLGFACSVTSIGCGPPSTPVAPMSDAGAPARAPSALDRCPPSAPVHVTIRREIANSSGRPVTEIENLVRPAITGRLRVASGIVVAQGEHVPDRCEVSFGVRVAPFDYSAGKLRVTVRIDVLSEPERSTLGNIEKKLTKEEVHGHEEASENELLQLASERAAEDLAKNIRRFVSDEPAQDVSEAGTDSGACGGVCAGHVGPALVVALQKRAQRSRRCYEVALASDKTLRGRVNVRMIVGRDGSLCQVSAEADEKAMATVASCVADSYRATERLPAPEGGCAQLNGPIMFVPRADDAGAP